MSIKNKFVFTKSVLDKLPIPTQEQKKQIYYDAYQQGLALIITYGSSKTFYLYKTIKHKTYIKKIGHYPYIDIEEARDKVFKIKKAIENNINPFELEKPQKSDTLLSDFFYNEYMPKYAKLRTQYKTYRRKELLFEYHCKQFKNKKLSDITRQEIEDYHRYIGNKQKPCAANSFLNLISHIYNIAIEWNFIDKNPALHIKPYPTKSRDRFLQPNEISDFMTALNNLQNDKMRDFILLLLLTGQRKNNIFRLKWSDIDFHNNIMYLDHTKNHESQRIPLTEQAINLLKSMHNKYFNPKQDWIFPSDRSNSGHIEDADLCWHQLLKSANIKNLHLHDLRRTMASYQAILGSSMNIISKSLGHKSLQSTAVYARLNLSPVRDSMQKATDEIFKLSDKDNV